MVAWLALAIAAATFVWKFIETYIRWPRVGVVLRQSATLHPAPAAISVTDLLPDQAPATGWTEDTFHVIVVNSGAEATTIATVGIRSEDRSRTVDIERLRDNGAQIAGPELPARVEAHGGLSWVVGHQHLKEMPRSTRLVGYASRYRTFRKYPKSRRNPLKFYETSISYVKN
jgi:hypothetical protein